ncbi:hypothetical protein DPMN_007420 [Dreissena polymorpha]|uniref:Uncharacterized protein n=1 Tax=Dreissena polymorpha TaxID=45954 RepID=A0A9D4MW67_DREPO|nr:hypothetical protein DPMN_007420 [Dreissena polymorpha]
MLSDFRVNGILAGDNRLNEHLQLSVANKRLTRERKCLVATQHTGCGGVFLEQGLQRCGVGT